METLLLELELQLGTLLMDVETGLELLLRAMEVPVSYTHLRAHET